MKTPIMDQSYQSYGGMDRPLFGESNRRVCLHWPIILDGIDCTFVCCFLNVLYGRQTFISKIEQKVMLELQEGFDIFINIYTDVSLKFLYISNIFTHWAVYIIMIYIWHCLLFLVIVCGWDNYVPFCKISLNKYIYIYINKCNSNTWFVIFILTVSWRLWRIWVGCL